MYPEIEICSDCNEGSSFVRDAFEGGYVSVCCWAKAVDPEAYESYNLEER